jgi:choline kinase
MTPSSDTVAIVLAAGVGSRLRPLTDSRPKCLVEVNGATVLARALAQLSRARVTRVILSTGYLAPMVREAVTRSPLPAECVDNPDYATTQNAVSLSRALDRVPAGHAIVKLDGDVVFQPEVMDAVMHCAAGDAIVAVDNSAAPRDEAMKVALDSGGRIRAFGKRIAPSQAHAESIGIEWIAAHAVPRVAHALRTATANGRSDVYYEDVYNDVLDELAFHAVPVDPRAWIEIDDLADLARARERFES